MGKPTTKSIAMAFLACATGLLLAGPAAAELSIYQIQYTTDPDGASPHAGSTVDCLGGVVTHKFPGYKPKLTLQDPSFPAGWGGIQVKDWTGGTLYDNVAVGDWVTLRNVLVEEFRGNTLLKYHGDLNSSFQVLSTGNPRPPARVVSVSEIAAPVEGPPGEWHVTNHSAEKYEAMWLTVEDVTVTDVDLGKAADNYVLSGGGASCWAGDYMNADVGGNYYHPYIALGAHFQSISGILEQYTKPSGGWDYYQLLTTATDDLIVPEPTTPALLALASCALLRRGRRGRRAPVGAIGR